MKTGRKHGWRGVTMWWYRAWRRMKRLVEKQDRLLEQYYQQLKRERQENRILRNRRGELLQGVEELSWVVDSVMAEVAVRYGDHWKDGSATIRLYETKDILERYSVSATKDTRGGYLIRATKKEKKTPGP